MKKNNASPILDLFATTPKGLELLLVDELRALGAMDVREKLAGVIFKSTLEVAYRACLWSRLANRILLHLAEYPVNSPDDLYAATQKIKWDEHINSNGTLCVHCVCSQSTITHSLYAAQKIKDAIVDQIRARHGVRPDVIKDEPDVMIFVHLHRNKATFYIDLSGESLHKRGYRLAAGKAPIKENLAAAVLIRAGWPLLMKQNAPLLDPMCGSGTFLIEAAMMAGDIAPALKRTYFGFLGWKKHHSAIWQRLVEEAEIRATKGILHVPSIVGYDIDPNVIAVAFENIERAGFLGKIHVEKRALSELSLQAKQKQQPGLLITNPPYGERLGEIQTLKPLYASLGDKMKQELIGWHAAVLTANVELGKEMGIRSKRFYALYNGLLPCKLLLFDIEPTYYKAPIDKPLS